MDHHRNLTMLIEGDFQQFFNMLENSHNGSLSRESDQSNLSIDDDIDFT